MARARTADDPQARFLAAALAMIAQSGWARFSLTGLAREEGVPLAEIYAVFPDRLAVISALGRSLDAAMLEGRVAELDELSPRERVFEIVMKRFDAMAPHKEAMRVLGRESWRDPGAIGRTACNLDRSAHWVLDAAGVDGPWLVRRAARRVLMALYVRVFNVWLDDETPDQARTLAELDKRLQQLELVTRRIPGLCARDARAGEVPPAAAG